jgi:hypothetical protein
MLTMKKMFLLTTILALAMCASAMAYTGILPTDNTPFTVQNVKAISPSPAGASCIRVAKTKGTIGTFTTQDTLGKFYLMLGWTSTDDAGAPLVVKRSLNSNSAFQPGASGDLTVNHNITGVTFTAYTTAASANRVYNICVDRQ